MKKYKYRGRLLAVQERELAGEKFFSTAFTDLKGFSRSFFYNSELVKRQTEAEAQADLDAFAARRGLKEVKERPLAGTRGVKKRN